MLMGNATEAAAASEQPRVTVVIEKDGDTVVLRIHDSGEAITDDARSQLFTPFFTTKPKGMGLGLASAASLVDAMGGSIGLEDDAKTFLLRLPRSME